MAVYRSSGGDFDLPANNLTVPEFMLDRTQKPTADHTSSDWVCLIDESNGRQVHFSEVHSRTARLSAALHAQRTIKPDDIVALIAPNTIDYPVCVWAVHRLGAIVAPLSPSMTKEELAHQLHIACPSVMIIQRELVSLAKDAAKHAGLVDYGIVIMNDDLEADLGYPTIDSLITLGMSLPPLDPRILKPGEAKTKLAFLSFSSGTTGLPKAVCISHYNVISNILQTAAFNRIEDPHLKWEDQRYRPGNVCSGVLPLYHIYGLVFNLHFIVYAQMTVVISAKFNFEKMLDSISRYQITNLVIVPPQALLICKHPAVERYNISSVRACMIAAAPISPELIQSFLRVLPGIHLGQGYGMTETCAALTLFPISPKVGIAGSAGKLLPGTTAKVVTNDGTLGIVGQRGELYVQGPQVTLGYYKNTAATQETFIDGWLRTGDEVYFDEEGNLFVVDRVKELIKVKGHQVPPAELEGHLLAHEAIADAAVIGIPDEFAGERPFALIVLKPQFASQVQNDTKVLTEIREKIFKHVSVSKSPHKWLTGGIEFVDSIPKSASGKILRRLIREQRGAIHRPKL